MLPESCGVHFAERVGETDVAPFARCRRKGQFLQICTEEEVRDTACRNNNDRDRKPHILVLEGTGVVMSEQDPVPMVSIPTAMQQRLYWKPVEGAMFRHMNQFVALLEVYSFATGKRYKRKAVRNSDKRKKATFICQQCKRGRVCVCIHRQNASLSWWFVRTVIMCECGSPPLDLVENLQSHGLTALVGITVEPTCPEWHLLANACFPCGWRRKLGTPERKWDISCQREDCPGLLRVEKQYVNYARRYDKFRILSAIDCCDKCRQFGGEHGPVPVRAPQGHDRTCPLCCQEQLQEWIQFACRQRICVRCLQKLVQACPSEIAKNPSLVVFDPDHNANHHYNCPFCKTAFRPQTKVVHYRYQGGDVIAQEEEVGGLVDIPYGYQSFDTDLPAHIANITEYNDWMDLCKLYVDDAGQEAILSDLNFSAELHAMAQEIVPRLQSVRQSGRFQQYQQPILNFMEAVEYLHVHGLDIGFLWRVANEADDDQRQFLMQTAYRFGWDGTENVDVHLVFNLLQRNGLVQVIDLVNDDSDSDYSDADY